VLLTRNEVTTGPNNNGFPSFAPDGRRFVYRTFGPNEDGLRIMDIETGVVSTLTQGYDNFPLWSRSDAHGRAAAVRRAVRHAV
jgi:Tol biopolymer transport system component